MAKILVYNNDTNRMETYYRGEAQPMPYNRNNTLTVGEFRGSSNSPTLWTTKRTMEAWNMQRAIFGSPIPVGFAFKRPWEGGHGIQSQHYAGVAFDTGQILSEAQRERLRISVTNSGLWTYVEPVELTPTWVHFDKRALPAACITGGYPMIMQGTRGVYVLIAQDGLNTLGFSAGSLDGIFGPRTRDAVSRYQRSRGLIADGIIGCNTWLSLQEEVVGNGSTNTTVN